MMLNTRLYLPSALCCLALFLLLEAPGNCYAQNSILVGVGSKNYPVKTEVLTASGTSRAYFDVKAKRSVCCEVRDRYSPGSSLAYYIVPPKRYPENSSVAYTAQGSAEPPIPTYNDNLHPEQTRVCFIPDASAYYYMDVDFGLTADDFVLQCFETSLYGGYNTSVTDFNFLEISNTLSSIDVVAYVTATNTVAGTVIMDMVPFTIPAGRRVDVDIHSRAGRGAFGSVEIAHDGPQGALKAVVSQYRIITQSPLNFEPVAQQLFDTR